MRSGTFLHGKLHWFAKNIQYFAIDQIFGILKVGQNSNNNPFFSEPTSITIVRV